MVLRKASSFIWATISTSPLATSVATQVTSPEASNLGWNASPSSRSWVWAELDTGMALVKPKRGLSIAFSREADTAPREVNASKQEPEAGSDATRTEKASALRPPHHGKETRLLGRIVAEHTGKAAGERRGAVLGDPAHRHAGMLSLDHHGDAAR